MLVKLLLPIILAAVQPVNTMKMAGLRRPSRRQPDGTRLLVIDDPFTPGPV